MTQHPWVHEDFRRMIADMGKISALSGIDKLVSIPPIVPPLDLQHSPAAVMAREMTAWQQRFHAQLVQPPIAIADRFMLPTALTTAWKPPVAVTTAWKPPLAVTAAWKPSLPQLMVPRVHVPDIRVPGLDKILGVLARRFPANWPKERPDLDLVCQIVEDEGIPLVYVPRANVVVELVDAADRDERVAILLDRTRAILDDCDEALHDTLGDEVEGQRGLLQNAVTALRDGHGDAAQALAVNVCDTLIGEHIDERHGKAKNWCGLGDLGHALWTDQLRIELGVAPVVNLLTEWNPKSGKPRPMALSRHVTIHRAHRDHYTPANAIIAVMVATGLMLALAEMHTKAAA
ncbi:hypothetical protein [Rhodococcus sp. UNC23MFCrub1.1]|uniref:hypothetical protein n=1 Tax=Rhodococcus sp. UNC23MFCrub1.1 TaxID=1449068 RepID=UPI0012DFA781|nr:hypothetical protein [Rhodococcus sp. UNC23MFCrub1.1]